MSAQYDPDREDPQREAAVARLREMQIAVSHCVLRGALEKVRYMEDSCITSGPPEWAGRVLHATVADVAAVEGLLASTSNPDEATQKASVALINRMGCSLGRYYSALTRPQNGQVTYHYRTPSAVGAIGAVRTVTLTVEGVTEAWKQLGAPPPPAEPPRPTRSAEDAEESRRKAADAASRQRVEGASRETVVSRIARDWLQRLVQRAVFTLPRAFTGDLPLGVGSSIHDPNEYVRDIKHAWENAAVPIPWALLLRIRQGAYVGFVEIPEESDHALNAAQDGLYAACGIDTFRDSPTPQSVYAAISREINAEHHVTTPAA